MLKPLSSGDTIALVAPSSPFEEEKFEKARASIEACGYKLSAGAHVFNRKNYLAGTEAERAADLIEAICSPDISAIMCVRGGYGSGRLLPWLPFSKLESKAKILLGFSDITFLHLAFASRMEWVTFHGPNFLDLGEDSKRCERVLKALEDEASFSWAIQDNDIWREGSVRGRIIGGNLTCLTHLIGSPYFPDLRGALLLIEDCNEAPYRLDRMFTHLKLAGILDQIGGMILGRFKDCGEDAILRDMVMDLLSSYRFPIVAGLPFGHIPENETVPFGIPFELNTYDCRLRALKSPFRR